MRCVFRSISLCFNTQPPEGGCAHRRMCRKTEWLFQHTAARRRLPEIALFVKDNRLFQHTAARRRLPKERLGGVCVENVSTHSRPKAAACFRGHANFGKSCFNTQPPEGGCGVLYYRRVSRTVSTHSRPKAAATLAYMRQASLGVSTHSRPKAAARISVKIPIWGASFNTQPPEGGCKQQGNGDFAADGFNTQPPEGGCPGQRGIIAPAACFNTQPPEGGCIRQR